jgi:hypothetical protein
LTTPGPRHSCALVLFFCLSFCLCAARPAPAAGPSAAIQAAYAQMHAAFARRDIDTALAFYAPGFVETTPKGETRDLAAARRLYQGRMGQIKAMRCRWGMQSVAPVVGGFVAEMRMHSEGTGEKRILFARLRGTFTNDLWVRDFWVSTPQGWRLRARRTLQDDTRTRPG